MVGYSGKSGKIITVDADGSYPHLSEKNFVV
jgi:hypothetical protein